MSKSSKISLHEGIMDCTIIENNLSIHLLNLIDSGIYNFDVKYINSEQELRDYHAQYHTCSMEDKFMQNSLTGPTICGYNKNYIPLIISGISIGRGIMQLIDDKLVYFPSGIGLINHRDSYLFAYNDVKIYTNVKPFELVKEFIDKGFELFFKDGTNPSKSEYGVYNLQLCGKPISLERIELDSIDTKLFE